MCTLIHLAGTFVASERRHCRCLLAANADRDRAHRTDHASTRAVRSPRTSHRLRRSGIGPARVSKGATAIAEAAPDRRDAPIVGGERLVPQELVVEMSIRNRRFLLLSSSALMALCFAGIASSQTPATPAPTPQKTPPASKTPAQPSRTIPPAPTTAHRDAADPARAPRRPPGVPGRCHRPARDGAGAAASSRADPLRQGRPRRPGAASPATGSRPAPAPTARRSRPLRANRRRAHRSGPRRAQHHQQQADPSEPERKGWAGCSSPCPAPPQPAWRRARSGRCCAGSTISACACRRTASTPWTCPTFGQDHGVPIDPLAIQKVEVLRGPEALRYGMQATGGIVDATNNRIPTRRRLAAGPQILGATTTVDRGIEGGALLDAGTRNFAIHADAYGRHSSDYFVPSYPYLFPPDPAPAFNGKQPNSGLHSEGQRGGRLVPVRRRLYRRCLFPLHQRLPHSHARRCGDQYPHRHAAGQVHQQRRVSPESSAIDVIRYLGRRGRISPRRAGLRRCRHRHVAGNVQQPCAGGQGRDQVHADDDPFRRADRQLRDPVRPRADRHRGRCRRPAQLRAHEPGRGLFLQ